jgi:UDP-2,3-diacylglucosamine pyrophosphatase LpxH
MIMRSSIALTKALFLASLLLHGAVVGADEVPKFDYDRAVLVGAKPWTSESFNNAPENFQFAVIGDRTGGADHRDIFVRAIDQLNLLQPEFVINVGDLIEGYSKDEERVNAEWDEVDTMLAKLEMPFFRTVGNHDLGNDAMQQVWLARHGSTYYHFVYGDVLFLVLNTEDPPRPSPEGIEEDIALYNRLQVEDPDKAKAMLDEFMAKVASYLGKPANFSDQQVAYVERALAQNVGVRWTFLFLHEPAWENPSENFLAIEKLLRGRDYTFFAGHLHYYDHKVRSGNDYITMGPAGASFHKDGPGNVDHILWVTMTENGPQIAKLSLDGIYDRKGRDLQLKGLYDRSRETQ